MMLNMAKKHIVSFKAKGSIYQSFVYTVKSFCLEADNINISLGTLFKHYILRIITVNDSMNQGCASLDL